MVKLCQQFQYPVPPEYPSNLVASLEEAAELPPNFVELDEAGQDFAPEYQRTIESILAEVRTRYRALQDRWFARICAEAEVQAQNPLPERVTYSPYTPLWVRY